MNWKSILIIFALAWGTIACGGSEHQEGGETQKTEQTEEQHQEGNHESQEGTEHQENSEATDTTASAEESQEGEAIAEAYQCPMKCEGDKVYHKPGKCPKCGMDLKPVKN